MLYRIALRSRAARVWPGGLFAIQRANTGSHDVRMAMTVIQSLCDSQGKCSMSVNQIADALKRLAAGLCAHHPHSADAGRPRGPLCGLLSLQPDQNSGPLLQEVIHTHLCSYTLLSLHPQYLHVKICTAGGAFEYSILRLEDARTEQLLCWNACMESSLSDLWRSMHTSCS